MKSKTNRNGISFGERSSSRIQSRPMMSLCVAAWCCVLGHGLAVRADDGVKPELREQVNALVKVEGPLDGDALDDLFRQATTLDGNADDLLAWLAEHRKETKDATSKAMAEIEAQIAYRKGDLNRALELLNELLQADDVAYESAAKKLVKKSDDAKGKSATPANSAQPASGDESSKSNTANPDKAKREKDKPAQTDKDQPSNGVKAAKAETKKPVFKLTRLDLHLWRARLFDATGKVAEAKQAYLNLIDQDLSGANQQKVRLRLALMGLVGSKTAKQTANAKELIELASKSKDVDFKNRAAIVLAIQNKFADAVKLFTVQGESTIRFRNASRFTEWAIRAKQRDKAIENAWIAVRSAQIKRDRRYALALLVEAYRLRDKLKGINALVEEFAKPDAERKAPLTEDMRRVWVDLLRELGRYDDAIALFKSSKQDDNGFSVEMRRELLEMEGEAGNDEQMLESYRQLISNEPHEMTWRAGLTRHFLEQARPDDARKLWQDYVPSLNDGASLLAAAQTLGDVGLDDLAEEAVERMLELKTDHGEALLYLSDLHRRRGRSKQAEATLHRLNQLDDVGDVARAELAAAFERMGRHDKSVEVIESIRKSRTTVAVDLEMRLAWLYSEIGNEDEAMNQWLRLWRKVNSVPRRRYVEDRLMTVASRLGTLADIAVDLEEKLMDGKADEREAGLLVRIYSRVKDSVAASEILEEYMTQSGQDEIERLQEKGRIYQICNDYWNYEKVVERLIEIDPAGRTEYLRQLALSMLERGKAQEARKVLLTLRGADDKKDSIGGEFEAGVLSLVGMNREAADSYRQAIASHPDRIESYLLLANQLKSMAETDLAVGMFQYLAENAERDDLFTIAIDGLLNMEAKGHALEWARRVTLERLADREDKNYLYQLLADLSAEVRDKDGQIRALENSLAVSGTRRLSVLRECMDLSSKIRGGSFYQSSSRGKGNAGNVPFFAFGRRLIALGELMPPQVFLDLGQAFLAEGDLVSAERTFGLARQLSDDRSYDRNVATVFESAGHRPEALQRYDRLLRTSPSDVAMIARVAKLNEQQGNDDVAARFYEQGLDLLVAQTPLTTQEEKTQPVNRFSYGGNRDAYQTYSERLLRGILVAVPDDKIEGLLQRQRALFEASLTELAGEIDDGRAVAKLADCPRIARRTGALRRFYLAFDRVSDLESMDETLLETFSNDKSLLTKFAQERVARGQLQSARGLASLAKDDDQRRALAAVLGEHKDGGDEANRRLSPQEMWRELLPVWNAGDFSAARRVLRRVDQKKSSSGSRVSYMMVNGGYMAVTGTSSGDVASWVRLALSLEDEGLALQFARGHVQRLIKSGRASYQLRQMFDTFRELLPANVYNSLAQFTMNAIKDDEKQTAMYLWLLANLGDELGDDRPTDEALLDMIEERGLTLNYYFPFEMAVESLPESIRDQALGRVIDGIEKNMRPRELVKIVMTHKEPLSPEVSKQILSGIKSGIQPALKDNRLRYVLYYVPLRRPTLACKQNADLAIATLDLLCDDSIRQRDAQVADWATYVRATVLHEIGRTDEALKVALKEYGKTDTDIKNYYSRNARQWLLNSTIQAHPEQFLKNLDAKTKDGKRTTKQTDERLTLIRRTKNDQLLREAYEQAWRDHPKVTKYVTEYGRWEQRAGRILKAIKIKERVLENAKNKLDAAKDDSARKAAQTAIANLERDLGDLWFSAGHATKGLAMWKRKDDLEIAKFESDRAKHLVAQAKADETAKAAGDKTAQEAPPKSDQDVKPDAEKATPTKTNLDANKTSNKTAPSKEAKTKSQDGALGSTTTESKPSGKKAAQKTPASTEATPEKATKTKATKITPKPKVSKPHRKKTVSDLKKSLEAKEKDAAEIRTTIRELWRKFPGVVESRYAYYGSSSAFNSLRWPANAKKKETKPAPDIVQRLTAIELQRQKLRKGLADFLAPTPAKVTRPQPDNAWAHLSTEPIARSEMQRILRSRSSIELKRCGNVIQGLLAARREKENDDVVFRSLMDEVKNGQADYTESRQLFEMLREKPDRIDSNDRDTIDAMLRQLDLDEGKPLSQIAWVCGKIGMKGRSASLYTQCALRAGSRDTDQMVSFKTLLDEASQIFSDDDLMDLAEKMFAVVPRRDIYTVLPILDLRMKMLSREEARRRSLDLFRKLESDPNRLTLQRAERGVELFAKAGDYKMANRCLQVLIFRNQRPTNSSSYTWRSSSSAKVSSKFERIFPSDGADFENYQAWLAAAASELSKYVAEGEGNIAFAIRMQLIVAYRQTTIGAIEAATETLQSIDGVLDDQGQQFKLLAIDVNREAGRTVRALELERELYEQGQLSHVRYGDLLADTQKAEGVDSAAKLLNELLEKTEDPDLLAAASNLMLDDADHVGRVADLQCKSHAAVYDREARKDAGKVRVKIRAEWAKSKSSSKTKTKTKTPTPTP